MLGTVQTKSFFFKFNALHARWRALDPLLHEMANLALTFLAKFFSNSKNPMIIVGDKILNSKQGDKIFTLIKLLAQEANVIRDDWNGFSYLSPNASRVGALEVGFFPNKGKNLISKIFSKNSKGKKKLLILIENDDLDLSLIHI